MGGFVPQTQGGAQQRAGRAGKGGRATGSTAAENPRRCGGARGLPTESRLRPFSAHTAGWLELWLHPFLCSTTAAGLGGGLGAGCFGVGEVGIRQVGALGMGLFLAGWCARLPAGACRWDLSLQGKLGAGTPGSRASPAPPREPRPRCRRQGDLE